MEIVSPKVCICGGGNIAHSLAAILSEYEPVSVFTRQPDRWASRLTYEKGENCDKHVCAYDIKASNDLSVVAEADCVLVCLPRFAIPELLARIDPVLHKGQTVMICPAPAGMNEIVDRYASRGIDTVGIQRVLYVARIREYGHSVWIADVSKAIIRMAFSRPEIADFWMSYVNSRFGCKVGKLSSFHIFTFSISNPLIHPSRLVELLKGGENGVYKECPYFYAEWTDASSEHYIKADEETLATFSAYSEADAEADYETALVHYESTNAHELTQKFRSIVALKPILAPWKQRQDGMWEPDFKSRYFTEDVPCGTKIIQQYARKVGVATPTIDYLVETIEKAAGL